MDKGGFVFSLDAFVAFTLMMVVIGLLIFTIGTPKPFYSELEQTHQLARDTLNVLATSSDGPGLTYLEQILGGADAEPILFKVAGGSNNTAYHPIIPKGYGYALERYNFNTNSWTSIYDAGNRNSSDRYGKSFTKVQASSTIFTSFYTDIPKPGESPFCHMGCRGYISYGNYQSPCNATPCNMPISNFIPGENSIQLVRFVVYA